VRPVVAPLQPGQQRLQRGLHVTDQRHVGRQSRADPDRVDVHLDDLCRSGCGEMFRVGEVRAQHQQRVDVLDQLLARPGTEQSDPAHHVRRVVRHRHLARQGLDDRRGQHLGRLLDEPARTARPDAGQDRDLAALVEQPRCGVHVLVPRPYRGRQVDRRRARRPGRGDAVVRVGVRVGDLDVVRHRQVRDALACVGGADRDVDQAGQLGRVDHHLVVDRHVLVEPVEVHLLLVPRAEHAGLLHPGDRQYRRVVQLRVVEPVGEVDAARPGRGQAHTDAAGRLGVGGRHERRGLLVVHEDEPHPVGVAAQPLHDPVDAVPG
jgi:hypothetical protein